MYVSPPYHVCRTACLHVPMSITWMCQCVCGGSYLDTSLYMLPVGFCVCEPDQSKTLVSTHRSVHQPTTMPSRFAPTHDKTPTHKSPTLEANPSVIDRHHMPSRFAPDDMTEQHYHTSATTSHPAVLQSVTPYGRGNEPLGPCQLDEQVDGWLVL
jgi:hypothetical protein